MLSPATAVQLYGEGGGREEVHLKLPPPPAPSDARERVGEHSPLASQILSRLLGNRANGLLRIQ